MKYLCLIYGDESAFQNMTHECLAFSESLHAGGQCLAAERLHPVRTATSVRVRNGEVSITDGPFAETKETLAGFYLIDARDLNDALRIASRMPPAAVGCVEVRPVRDLTATTDPVLSHSQRGEQS